MSKKPVFHLLLRNEEPVLANLKKERPMEIMSLNPQGRYKKTKSILDNIKRLKTEESNLEAEEFNFRSGNLGSEFIG